MKDLSFEQIMQDRAERARGNAQGPEALHMEVMARLAGGATRVDIASACAEKITREHLCEEV